MRPRYIYAATVPYFRVETGVARLYQIAILLDLEAVYDKEKRSGGGCRVGERVSRRISKKIY